MQKLHPKVKVPLVVGQVISAALAIFALVGQFVPAALPITTEATSIVLAVSGYLAYSRR
jgi:hypothetical protein